MIVACGAAAAFVPARRAVLTDPIAPIGTSSQVTSTGEAGAFAVE
jgi:hypothetical protein